MNLSCAFCLYLENGEAKDAVTVLNGHAVCMDHAAYVQGGDFSCRLAIAVAELARQRR